MGASISLQEITGDTVDRVLALGVAPAQQQFVASNAKSLAQALFAPEAWYRAICADEIPVGFLMLEVRPETAEYGVWRFMIDQDHQRQGIGGQALEQAAAYVRTLPNATRLWTSVVPGPGSPQAFYERHGFVPTGDVDGGEVVLCRDLTVDGP